MGDVLYTFTLKGLFYEQDAGLGKHCIAGFPRKALWHRHDYCTYSKLCIVTWKRISRQSNIKSVHIISQANAVASYTQFLQSVSLQKSDGVNIHQLVVKNHICPFF